MRSRAAGGPDAPAVARVSGAGVGVAGIVGALGVAAVLGLLGVLGAAEWLHWRASGRRLGSPAAEPGSPSPEPGRQAILVLGSRNRGDRANYVNRYRVRVALRSIDPRATETVLIFSGGAVGSDIPEADLLLRHARDDLGYAGPALCERTSTSTWTNVENSLELLHGFDTIVVASNSIHAERARAYLWKLRPDLARRLVRARDYRLGEILLVKPVAAVRGVVALRRFVA